MTRVCLSVLIAVICATFQSCNIMAGVGYIVSKEPQKEAVFVLPDVPTVVFVDDRRNIMHPTRLRRVVADEITKALIENQLVTNLISPQDILRVSAAKDRYGEILPIDELGKAVGATTVIYVELTAFALTTDGQTANPIANCRVRVIDAVQKKRLFPTTSAAYPVIATIKKVNPYTVHSASETKKLAEELALVLGNNVAEMFYLHYTGRLGENLERQ